MSQGTSREEAESKKPKQAGPAPDSQKKQTCFAIMPISDHPNYPTGHFKEVFEYLIKPAAELAGFDCERADTTSASHMIHVEIVSKVHGAELCICDLSTRNPNVLYELGIRQAFDKPTVLINDDKTDRVFDVEGFRYSSYSADLRPNNLETDRANLVRAITHTMESHGKENQIFSLVSFLGLKAAAVSGITETPENAHLAIIDRKLTTLMAIVENSGRSSTEARWSAQHGRLPAEVPGIGLSPLSAMVQGVLKGEPQLRATDVFSFEGLDVVLLSDGGLVYQESARHMHPARLRSVKDLGARLLAEGFPKDRVDEICRRIS